jgi:hypothetical protein
MAELEESRPRSATLSRIESRLLANHIFTLQFRASWKSIDRIFFVVLHYITRDLGPNSVFEIIIVVGEYDGVKVVTRRSISTEKGF